MHACEDAQGDRRKLVFDTGIHKESLMHMFRKSITDFSEYDYYDCYH